MRISTAAQHASAYLAISKRYEALLKTQNQMASGQRIQTPADDPSGAVRALDLDRSLAESQQFGAQRGHRKEPPVARRADARPMPPACIDRIRTLTVQANTSTVDAESRKSITVEMQARLRELVDIANRRDSNGEYLFSGLSTLVQPFSQIRQQRQLFGRPRRAQRADQSSRSKSPTVTPGFDVFLDVVNGNGTFVTARRRCEYGHAASSVRAALPIRLHGCQIPTPCISRAPPTGKCSMAPATQITTGTYASPGTIAFNGIQMEHHRRTADGRHLHHFAQRQAGHVHHGVRTCSQP